MPKGAYNWNGKKGYALGGALIGAALILEIIRYKGKCKTVVREALLRAATNRDQTSPDYGCHTWSRSKGDDLHKEAPAEEHAAKTSNWPSAILDQQRKYTVFQACSYATNTKEEPQPLSANSSHEHQRIAPKRSHLSHSVPHLNIRW